MYDAECQSVHQSLPQFLIMSSLSSVRSREVRQMTVVTVHENEQWSVFPVEVLAQRMRPTSYLWYSSLLA